MCKTLIIFEFIDEVESFDSTYGLASISGRNALVLALQPEVQAYLKRKKVDYLNTIDFFDRDSHQNLLLKSDEIIQSFRSLLDIKDDLGIVGGYNNAFIYHIRSFVHYLLWLIEIIDRAVSQLGIEKLVAPYREKQFCMSNTVSSQERYVGNICKSFSEIKSIKFEPFFDKSQKQYLPQSEKLKEIVREVVKLLTHKIYCAYFYYRSNGKKLILAPTDGYNMQNVTEQFNDVLTVYLSSRSNKRFGDTKRMLKNNNFVTLSVIPGLLSKKKKDGFLMRVTPEINKLYDCINSNSHLLNYRGVDFKDLVLCKIENGIKPFLIKLYGHSVTVSKFLAKHKPSLLLSQMAREITYNLGELAGLYGIASVLISHGSHVPVSNKYEEIEWGEHGLGLINTHYEYVAMQSPWAKEQFDALSSDSQPIITGPLVFTKIKRNDDEKISLRRRIVPNFAEQTIIVHAGTPKPRRYMRFYIYETMDEYIANTNSLIKSIESIANVHLIVRFRPSEFITEQDFADLLVKSDSYSIHSEGSFADYLKIADLLVSYSSTTIEEALQNKIPVLQYDPQGKYCHIKGELLRSDAQPKINSCYFVDSEEHLRWAVGWFIKNHLNKAVPESEWERHVFAEEEKISLPVFFKDVLNKAPC
ncbi:MAG: hypothetical protein FVQ80_00455 [Planctomycetes bacterium]|nr:hypothetical protein [Planctomycetota bacterium]